MTTGTPYARPAGALGVGLVHGMGGSAGVGVLLLAAIPSETVAVASLLLLALFTAVSMTVVTVGFGLTLTARPRRGGVEQGDPGARRAQPRVRRLVRRGGLGARSVSVLSRRAIGSASVEQLLTLDDAERLAEQVVAPEAWSYIVGGAGDERTLRWNREAFSRYRLRPRVLVDVSTVTTETTVLGTPVSMPVLVAPMAFQQIAHEEGELAMARGAAAAETLMCLSTVATATPADIAAAAPGAPRWLQIYVFRDREVSATTSSSRRSSRDSRRSC